VRPGPRPGRPTPGRHPAGTRPAPGRQPLSYSRHISPTHPSGLGPAAATGQVCAETAVATTV